MKKERPHFWKNLKLLHQFKKAGRQLQALSVYPQKYDRNAAALADQLLAKEVTAILQATPGEVLKKYKTGARILPISNISVHSLSKMPVQKIAAIDGMGPKSAPAIKRCVAAYEAEVKEQSRIHISPDSKSPEERRLVKNLYQIDQLEQISDEAKKLSASVFEENAELLKKARPAAHPLLWLTSRSKEAASNSMDEIQALLQSPIITEIDYMKKRRSELLRESHDVYWKAFCKDPVRFYSTLDDVREKQNNKGKKRDVPVYLKDLPPELRTQIAAVPVDSRGLKCRLRPYQYSGVQYILSQGNVLLGDEMGLGKTIEAIASIVSLHNHGAKYFVVICPASVLINWEREIHNHSDMNCFVLHGARFQNQLEEWKQKGGIAIVNFEGVGKADFDTPINMTVVDEAHYIKNSAAARTHNTKRVLLQSERRLFLSGTPLENRLEEMMSLISMLQPSVVKQVYKQQQPIRADVYKQIIAPVYYRRTKDAVWKEMPELQVIEDYVELSSAEKELYISCIKERSMSSFTTMRQVSFRIQDKQKSSKLNRIKDICQEAFANGRKVLIFSFYLNTINAVIAFLSECVGDSLFGPITGAISPEARQTVIDRFSEHEGGAVLLSQITAGGTGLNIQSASIVILCEPQYKPSIENQAIARAFRMGQKSNVSAYRLLCSKTVDERILQMLKEKQELFDAYADKSVSGEKSLQLTESEVARAEFSNCFLDEEEREQKMKPDEDGRS